MDKQQKKALQEAEEYQLIKLNERAVIRMSRGEEQAERAEGEETDEELINLAETDASAAEVLAIRYVEEKKFQKALPYIVKALKANSFTAANFVEGLLEYGTAHFDRDIEIYGLAVSEQFYDDASGKKLLKVMLGKDAKDIGYVLAADMQILGEMLEDSLFTAHSAGKYDTLEFKVERAAKHSPVRDYKNSYVLSLNLYNGGNEPAYEDYGLYIFNPRAKKSSESDEILGILEKLTSLGGKAAEAFGLKECRIDILGKKYTSTHGGQAQDNGSAKAKFHAQKGGIQDEQVGIRVNAVEKELLEAQVCACCGMPCGAEKVCPHCGGKTGGMQTANKKDGEGIVINVGESQEEKMLTALVCSQCGSPVYVSGEEGESVLCGACGSSFILNKKALGMINAGIDFESMEADKPKDAQIPELKFILKSLFDGKLGVIMPDCFELMDAAMKAIKYPKANPPQYVYTDETGKTNFTFTVRFDQKVTDKEIPIAGEQILTTFKKLMPAAVFGDNGVYEKEGRKVAYFECITPAADTHIYNFMTHFCLSGHIVCGAFNCIAEDRWFWSHIFKLAAQSVRYDD